MLTIYLLRHGETVYNAEGNRYCGRTDVALTENGIRQAQRVAGLLAHIDFEAVYASPLVRATTTAEIVCGGRLPVVTDRRLIEVDFGGWEGKTREEFMAENPTQWNSWKDNPESVAAGGSGETGFQVVHRVEEAFADIVNRHQVGNVMVVAHNGVNRLYLSWMLGMPMRNYRRIVQENSAITQIRLGGEEGFSLLKLNA